MEGLLDHTLRDVLTRMGGVDRCVSEFIRVTGQLLPPRAFTRIAPELLRGARTPAGVPVRPQLLGSDAVCLAENAARLAEISPFGVDLNFGCPAKTVNRHHGGAALLADPDLVGRIVQAVRRAVPAHLPVSAKMRLGVHDDAPALDCARAIAQAGADELVVHARTRAQGYRPPAHWERVADIRACVRIPVIANGDIWTPDDARRCQAVTGCGALMIGRGMVRDPALARQIAGFSAGVVAPEATWAELLPLIDVFWRQISARVAPRHRAGRLKQWLNALRGRFPQAQQAFEQLRPVGDARQIDLWLSGTLRSLALPPPSMAPPPVFIHHSK
ncbi:MAG: tRNA-dihydrouridine synthase [Burkholderiaceae bacterium]|nr:tRNA-dihydrouridine synthase [Burkholderiaceae bacterium]